MVAQGGGDSVVICFGWMGFCRDLWEFNRALGFCVRATVHLLCLTVVNDSVHPSGWTGEQAESRVSLPIFFSSHSVIVPFCAWASAALRRRR